LLIPWVFNHSPISIAFSEKSLANRRLLIATPLKNFSAKNATRKYLVSVATRNKPSLNRKFSPQRGAFVRVGGTPVGYAIERNADANRIDHLTITLRAGEFGVVIIALNTYSLRSLNAGVDPRIRLAIIGSTWNTLPPAGVSPSAGLDYSLLEKQSEVAYREYERVSLEAFLIENINRSAFIEGWGEFYLRDHSGIHQVHSRRASCAVQSDYYGRDGAIQFYFQENRAAELLLFKFCGQV
jgi:hypothetical protein